METILITVSVLSTLAVVAIVLSVVVILNKLEGKVDVEVINTIIRDNENNNTHLEREISEVNEQINRRIDKEVNDINQHSIDVEHNISNYIGEVDKRLDSRSDKLYDHMGKELENLHQEINKNQKVLLKD
jgi:predicted PurR-regulated permease PerM